MCQLKVWKYLFIKKDKELHLRMTNKTITKLLYSLASAGDLVQIFLFSSSRIF